MTKLPSVAVIGLGIVGASITARLAEAGYAVTAFDQFLPPHVRGSSHGENRLYRRVPAEGEVYVAMSALAYDLWPEIERESGRHLFDRLGCMDISENGKQWAQRSYDMAKQYSVPVELLDHDTAAQKQPFFKFKTGMTISFSPVSGVLRAEESVLAFLDIARQNGARIVSNAKVVSIEPDVKLADGSIHTFDYIIVAAGSWVNQLLSLPVRVEKRVLGWYSAALPMKNVSGFTQAGDQCSLYGMPGLDGRTLKIGEDQHLNEVINPDADLQVTQKDRDFLDSCVAHSLQNLDAKAVGYTACKYTLADNDDFIIDRFPNEPRVLFFSPCSGHGFKYAPVYGEIALAMVQEQTDRLGFDLKHFALQG